MKFELAHSEQILVNEECPVCKNKGFMRFVGYDSVSEGILELSIRTRETGEYIQCALCKAVFKIPKELKK